EWQLALELLQRMPELGATADVISYNAAISACEKAGQWQMAVALLARMPKVGLNPNVISYNAAICACERGLQWESVLDLTRQMSAARVAMNTATHTAALMTFSSAGRWQEALSLGPGGSPRAADLGRSCGTLLMECEQRDLLAVEVSLTDRLSAAAREGRELPADLALVLDLSARLRRREQQPQELQGLFQALRRPRPQGGGRTWASLPYQRELQLLRHVLTEAPAGSAAAAAAAVDDFGAELGEAGSWAKFAGGSKAATLLAAVRGARLGDRVLEIGTYCGNSALRLAAALPGVRVTTLELDPLLVAIARSLLAFAGLAASVDVWTGPSKLLLPRLRPLRFSAIFVDRWGSQYDEDLALIQEHELLQQAGGVLVADNVLTTAAASFLWQVAHPPSNSFEGAFTSRMLAVREVAQSSEEDWMSVSVANFQADVFRQAPPIPPELLALQAASERLRERVIRSEAARLEKGAFTEHAKATLSGAGIAPLE
ncbi:unnamed protein product, partial [Polarella glacialis]